MQLIEDPKLVSQIVLREKRKNLKIGFVPTMGALHEGHLELIKNSKKECDFTVVSIFVNPLQFNASADLEAYPRDLKNDISLLQQEKVDLLFNPSNDVMYQVSPSVSISFGRMAEVLEGKFRKGHFDGVGVVVAKLLNIVNPDRAFFGLKDLQQFLLIKTMCRELNFQTTVIGVPTVRNENGLALSSRNRRLTKEGILIATQINLGLVGIEKRILGQRGEIDVTELLAECSSFYKRVEGLEIEYLEAVNAMDLKLCSSTSDVNELAICVAGYVEGVRLIDNLYLRLK